MKFGKTAKAIAIAVAVGMSSHVMADTTQQWWSFNFDDVSNSITTLTNEALYTTGQWTTAAGDESSVTNELIGHATSALKLDTQGTDLTWTPTAGSCTSTVVLVDADIYLVGSDTPPTGFDPAESPRVQTAVYLKNNVDEEGATLSSVLCAYVAQGESSNKWVELQGFTMTDTNWYHVRIEVDYNPAVPVAKFIVEEAVMQDSEANSSFQIANYMQFNAEELKKVNSVSFRGTGAVDNFVGNQVVPSVAAELTFTVSTFTDLEPSSGNNIAGTTSGTTVTAGDPFFVSFTQFDSVETSTSLSLVRVYTNEAENLYVDYNATYGEPWTFDVDSPLFVDEATDGGIRLNIDTTGLAAGYTIKAYYGEKPAVAANKTVTFDPGDGTGAMTPQVANMGTALTANTFTYTGYTFTGWNTESDGSGTHYADQAIYPFTVDVTLYAQWAITQYTITFDSDGGTAVSPITQAAGTPVTAPAAPTKEGYTFASWSPEVPSTMPAESFTITAQWTANPTDDVTFDSEGANLVFTSIDIVGTTATVGFTASGTVNVGAEETSTLWVIVTETLGGTESHVEVEADATSTDNVIEGTFTIQTTPDTQFISGINNEAPVPPAEL